MKKIFDNNGRYTDKAVEISSEIEKLIGEIFKKYLNQGYSLSELGYLGFSVVSRMGMGLEKEIK